MLKVEEECTGSASKHFKKSNVIQKLLPNHKYVAITLKYSVTVLCCFFLLEGFLLGGKVITVVVFKALNRRSYHGFSPKGQAVS